MHLAKLSPYLGRFAQPFGLKVLLRVKELTFRNSARGEGSGSPKLLVYKKWENLGEIPNTPLHPLEIFSQF